MASAGDDEDDGMDFFEMLGIKNRNRMDGAFSTHRSRHSSFHMRAPSTYISLVSNQSFIFETHFFLRWCLAFHHHPHRMRARAADGARECGHDESGFHFLRAMR